VLYETVSRNKNKYKHIYKYKCKNKKEREVLETVLPRKKFRLHFHVITVYSRRPDHFVHLMIQNSIFKNP